MSAGSLTVVTQRGRTVTVRAETSLGDKWEGDIVLPTHHRYYRFYVKVDDYGKIEGVVATPEPRREGKQ